MHLVLYRVVAARMAAKPGRPAAEPIRAGNGFALVLKSPYLRLVALLLVILNIVNTVGEYILGQAVVAHADAEQAVNAAPSTSRQLSMTTARGLAPPDASAAVAPPKVAGVRILGGGFFVPKGWDAEEAFGGVEGSVAGYLGSEKLTLATRVGGQAIWGKYPWFESASISGTAGDVRGYSDGRFRGDSSLFGNAELRVDRQAEERRAPAVLGPQRLRRVRSCVVPGRRVERVAHRLRRRADVAAHRHAHGCQCLDRDRHGRRPLLLRGRLIGLSPTIGLTRALAPAVPPRYYAAVFSQPSLQVVD